MTITAWVLSTIPDYLDPTAWFGAQSRPFRFGLAALDWSQPRSQPPAAQANAGRTSAPKITDLADLHAYQASPQGMIEQQVHDLAAITAALVQYATAPTTRHLVAHETKGLEVAAARLGFVLRLLAQEGRP
jgi:hypothetical protein